MYLVMVIIFMTPLQNNLKLFAVLSTFLHITRISRQGLIYSNIRHLQIYGYCDSIIKCYICNAQTWNFFIGVMAAWTGLTQPETYLVMDMTGLKDWESLQCFVGRLFCFSFSVLLQAKDRAPIPILCQFFLFKLTAVYVL